MFSLHCSGRYLEFWLLVLILVCISTGPVFAGRDDSLDRDFLLNRMMIAKLRESRGDPAGKALLESLRDEAAQRGIKIPDWARAGLSSKPHGQHIGFKESLIPAGKYDVLIQKASHVYLLPPALIKAVIRAESAFMHDAVSPKGAQGLMQLMPATADAIGVQNPFDPRANIFGGSRLIRKYLNQFGSLKKTLIAYNAGPGWLRSGRPIPKETRDYIQRVITYYRAYAKRP